MMDKHELTLLLKARAREIGFDAIGIAEAAEVDPAAQREYRRWIDDGCHGTMEYLERNMDLRFDPRKLVPGTRSIIMVAMNYYPQRHQEDDTLKIAWYAYGKDYHDVVKQKLWELLSYLKELCPDTEGRAFTDSAPFLERYWAERAGIGFNAMNRQLIIKESASTYFLGELLVNTELEYDTPLEETCLRCGACLRACPTGALQTREDGTTRLDAKRCISYLTIENRGPIPEEYVNLLGDSIYGCDRCQTVCPYIRRQNATSISEFMPSEELLSMRNGDWQNMDEDTYRRLFKGSAVKRAKFEGLKRNIDTVSKRQRQ